MRMEFKLTMPSIGSWNGRWSGEGRNYVKYRVVSPKRAVELNGRNFYHRWEDGWAANVHVRLMNPGERKQKSAGFCGYEWMIDNILLYGRTEAPKPILAQGA